MHVCTCNGCIIYLRRHRRRAARKSMKLSVSETLERNISEEEQLGKVGKKGQRVTRMKTEDMVAGHYPSQRMDEIIQSWRLDEREGKKCTCEKAALKGRIQGAAASNWQVEDAADRVGLDLA